ncbi:DUF962 domain-containing protein [Aquisalinus flavus]|uniref:DUF962 domain-containing protein n=1 Tax=Aquisalinus flavus TaxID=1526572 RepID=A0A8J2V6A9_9PROT|nr:DUF962 domain-containing protein [Aquisalinus flavus]MBD0425438.1 DUF962 domain-containing protein [Aquisalinus flavus]UNE48923.1 DUF962 domain-containing protein [Aquisalinus flavus]GGD16040.1 hypothetical protein GCM10011342_26050 [Aquisalinus flavus]
MAVEETREEYTDPPEKGGRIASFTAFFPFYLREHSEPACRRMHYIGTGLTLIAYAAAVLVNPWWLLAAPLAGYGFAWFAHFKYERNKPATFKYPLWSLMSDYRMFFLWVTGRLDPHLDAAGVPADKR